MAVSAIQLGQVWRLRESGESWLVTKVYSEMFTSYAILRKAGGSEADVRRLKIERTPEGVVLSGFVFDQDAGPF